MLVETCRVGPDALWGAVQAYGNQEQRAAVNLRRQGFTAFYPSFLDRDGRSRPAFPCYLFVHLEEHLQWSSINSTFGVIRLLADRDGRPKRVPSSFVASIRRCLIPDPSRGSDVLDPGTRVRIKHGVFAEREAVVQWSSLDRLGLLFSMFANQDARVEMYASDVEVLEVA